MSGVKLKIGGSFFDWKTSLTSKLAQKNLVGHVFHDIHGMSPKEKPSALTGNMSTAAREKYEKELEKWVRNDLIARDIVIQSLDDSLKLPSNESVYRNTSARSIYERVLEKCREWASDEQSAALKGLMNTKFTYDADEYISTFACNLRAWYEAARLQNSNSEDDKKISEDPCDVLFAVIFMAGTKDVEWLRCWRGSITVKETLDGDVSLEYMMTSLRRRAGRSIVSDNPALDGKCVGDRPDDLCNKKGCQRLKNHTNERCFRR